MKTDYSNKLLKISKLSPTIQQIVFSAFLSKLFEEKKVTLTVVGGAAVQFYTQASYNTKDVDAILQGDTTEIIEEVMASIGFKRTTTYRHFEHPDFGFVVEFPPQPIEVASRYISKIASIETEEGLVRIIRVEDLIMDRITAGIEWQSERSINQAKLLWIKNKHHIDRKYLTQFAKEEGYLKTLKDIMKSKPTP